MSKKKESAEMKKRYAPFEESNRSMQALIYKIVLLGILDAAATFAAFVLFMNEAWIPLVILALSTAAINWIYFRKGGVPAKYLTPGVIFLIAFQISVLIFSFFTAFTNYSSPHNGDIKFSTKAILDANFELNPDSPSYSVSWVKDAKGNTASLISTQDFKLDADGFPITDPNTGEVVINYTDIYLGLPNEVLKPLTDRSQITWQNPAGDCTSLDVNCGYALSIPGYTPIDVKKLSVDSRNGLFGIKFWEDTEKTRFLKLVDLGSANEATARFIFKNPNNDYSHPSLTRISDGTVFKPSADGFYRADGKIDGEKATDIGWEVVVGFKNFNTIFGDKNLRIPLLKIISWTVAFAVLSVLTTFILGLAISLLFDDARLKGKKIYRSIMILPYAFPGFLSAYVWKGLFNQKYGFINTVILGQPNAAVGDDLSIADHNTPWLTDGSYAKLAVLLVNLWLGFPYMFLITTGALQAIPQELTESATIDGATPGQILRLIKLPLLLVSLAPLLISSFAFNFNNFNIIYLLTGGGPTNTATGYDAGETDILITFVYKIAFSTGHGRDYGLASAFSILIFLVVGTMSLISFRRTKFLEDIN